MTTETEPGPTEIFRPGTSTTLAISSHIGVEARADGVAFQLFGVPRYPQRYLGLNLSFDWSGQCCHEDGCCQGPFCIYCWVSNPNLEQNDGDQPFDFRAPWLNSFTYFDPQERPWGTEIVIPWHLFAGAPERDRVALRINMRGVVTYQELRLPPGLWNLTASGAQ
jgi:hypothetical protein